MYDFKYLSYVSYRLDILYLENVKGKGEKEGKYFPSFSPFLFICFVDCQMVYIFSLKDVHYNIYMVYSICSYLNHFSYEELWIYKAIVSFFIRKFIFQLHRPWIICHCCMVTNFVDFIHLLIISNRDCIQNEDIL